MIWKMIKYQIHYNYILLSHEINKRDKAKLRKATAEIVMMTILMIIMMITGSFPENVYFGFFFYSRSP